MPPLAKPLPRPSRPIPLKPARRNLPISPGFAPGWDLADVPTDHLMAELIRRGYNFVRRDAVKVVKATKGAK